MGFLALLTGSTVIQTLVVGLISDRGGAWAAKLLGRRGMLGFGTTAAKAMAKRRQEKKQQVAATQTRDWLAAELAALDEDVAAVSPRKLKAARKRKTARG